MNTRKSSGWVEWLGWATLVVVAVGLYLSFIYAPTEAQMGSIQRIFYFHLGADTVGLGAIIVAAVASILYLRSGKAGYDRVALASMELGLVFGLIALLTGMIWARPVWGTWWTWDPRLTTFLILWLIYIAYLMLRATASGDPRMARLAAVFAIVGVADVPLVIIAPRIWRGISPVLFGVNDVQQFSFNMEPPMVVALVVSIIGFLMLYVYLLAQRVQLETLRSEVEALHTGEMVG
ncbi:MAG: cytochrome c biogenesis protein CcsA [Anaerolineae bacterium]